jgi:lipopolysaccharide/colanic/teichoic acid biosynthesis glycosyltransferase
MVKRYLDILAAGLGLVLLAPLLIAIAALIRLDDGGSVLFTQWRLGRHRHPYRIYKFRSMRDERITRVGKWLRTTGLDELPQLVNVLLGHMSVIGPRPLTADDVARIGWDDDAHALRWRVRPGITGLAQIYAGRGKRLSWFLDCRYVLGRSLGMDLQILMLSAAMVLAGKYRIRAWLRSPTGPRRMSWELRPWRLGAPAQRVLRTAVAER